MSNDTRSALGDEFDRSIRSLTDLPDVVKTSPSTVRALTPVLNLSQTFIVQTYRQREKGDTIFIEYVGAEGSFRLALPPVVSQTIARQRDALSTKNRRNAGRNAVEARIAAGEDLGATLRNPEVQAKARAARAARKAKARRARR